MLPTISQDHHAISARIAQDIEQFLSSGGRIDRCETTTQVDPITTFNGRISNGEHTSRGGKAKHGTNTVQRGQTAAYLSISEIVRKPRTRNCLIPISRTELMRRIEKGTFPAPDAHIGPTYLWKRETIEKLAQQFKGKKK